MAVRKSKSSPSSQDGIQHLIQHNLRLGPIEYLSPEQLLLPPRRLKKHPEKMIVGVKASITTFGVVAPILIDQDNVVVDGEAILEAAKQLKLPQIPVVRLDHLGSNEIRLLRLTLKKLATKADWNASELRLELIELLDIESEISIDVTGFEWAEIDQLVSAPSDVDELEEGGLPEPLEADAVSRLGDVWVFGPHRLFCGSSLDQASFETLMQGERAQMVLTDSPYNVKIAGNVSGLGKKTHREFLQASGEMSEPEFARFQIDSISRHADACADGALLFMFMDWKHGGEMYEAIPASGLELKNMVVWVKSQGGMGSLYRSRHELVFVAKKGKAPHRNNVQMGKFGRNRDNVWHYPGMNSFGRDRDELLAMHPTCKNLTMFQDAIRDVTNRGEIVLDGFAGSGTTIIAAEKTGRIARCIELDPLYVDCIVRRWEKFSGTPARLGTSEGPTFAEIEAERIGVFLAVRMPVSNSIYQRQ